MQILNQRFLHNYLNDRLNEIERMILEQINKKIEQSDDVLDIELLISKNGYRQ